MNNLIDGFHDVGPDFIEILQLRHSLMELSIVTVDAIVHDTIQIEVEIIY